METCFLCKSSKKDDLIYGDFLRNKKMGIGVHTFCLYLSSNLSQSGADDEGFLGFLELDIKKEQLRVSHLKCCYCKSPFANIGCCEKKCRRTFHLICGIENGAENQFCNSYKSFCHKHRRKDDSSPPPETSCLICYENLREEDERFNPLQMIQSPCCRNGFFHRLCLLKFAKNAGYFFKCPLCNDAKIFRQKLPAKGIFIPNQDAAWELEPNAFAELLERPSECSASVCENRNGRSYTSTNNPLLLCSTCGSTAIHKLCLPPPRGSRFHCADCTIALEERDSGRESLNSHPNANGDEFDEIDVCNVSDQENLNIIQGLFADITPDCQQKEDVYSPDEEITMRRNNIRLLSSESECSSTSKENIKPSSIKNKITTNVVTKASSSNANKNKCNKPRGGPKVAREDVSNSRRRILYTIEDDEVEIIHNKNTTHYRIPTTKSKMIADDSDDSSTDNEDECLLRSSKKRPSKYRIGDDDDDMQTKSKENTKSLSIKQKKSSVDSGKEEKRLSTSSEEELMPIRSVRRVARIQSNEVDDDSEIPKKKSRIETSCSTSVDDSDRITTTLVAKPSYAPIDDDSDEDEPIQNEHVNSAGMDSALSEPTSEESEEDDDPLENYTKLIEKQKNISCVAHRTRRRSMVDDHPQHQNNTKTCNSNMGASKQTSATAETSASRHIRFKSQPQQSSAKHDNLDISCIAKRTRRKSMFCERIMPKDECSKQAEKLDTSCVAIRTRGRRKTVCSETSVERKKLEEQRQDIEKRMEIRSTTEILEGKPFGDKEESIIVSAESSSSYQMSQIYEIECETDEDIDNFIVPDNYAEHEKHINQNEPKLSAFEISCVANRTRKRKGLKAPEADYEEMSSGCSSSSHYTELTDNKSNNNQRKHGGGKLTILSEDTTSQEPLTTLHKRYNEIWPKQNNDLAFFKSKFGSKNNVSSKTQSQQSYHPSNYHHPHISNRRRN